MNCKNVLLPFLICLTGVAAMAQNDGIVLNKTVANQIWDKTTQSKLTLEAYATGEVVITETEEQVPCDIVLVMDASGSMKDPMPSSEYGAVTKGFSPFDILNATAYDRNPYYYLENGVYYEVKYYDPVSGKWSIYIEKDGIKYYFCEEGSPGTDMCSTGDPMNILWTGTLYQKNELKIDVFKSVVCNFIDIVADSAVKNNVDHKISLVKFGSPKYYISEESLEENDEFILDTFDYYYYMDSAGNYLNSNGTGFEYEDGTTLPEGSTVDTLSDYYFMFNTLYDSAGNEVFYTGTGFEYEDGTTLPEGSTIIAEDFDEDYAMETFNATQVMKNLKNVSSAANVEALKASVNKLSPLGPTAADYGMTKATYILQPSNPDYVPGTTEQKRNKVVILFTDGVPTHANHFSESVANRAIALAKALKDSGAVVYTIGLLDELDEKVYKYMSYVSSKYPSATALDAPGSDSASGDYFFYVTTSEGLTGVFENIAKQTPSGGAMLSGLNETTVVKDVLTKYFKLPAGTNTSDIKVYTANYNAATETFAAPQEINSAVISFADSNKTINVNGFNFSEHWCGPNAPDGQKLIIEIPIVFNNVPEDKSFDWTHVPTNEDESAIYASDGTLIKRFPVPYADLSAVVLPIELIAFQAECMDNAIQFTWSTATETNNEYFTIDRSEDAVHYTEVARVQGAGTSAFRQDYSFMTDNTTNKTMYYRLRQTDIDGTTEAFSPIAVQCGTTGKTDVVMYPMPATDQLHIASSEEISYMQFYNVYGDDAKQVQVNAYNANVDITDLSSGIYMLKITMCDGKIITKKIVKSTYQH